MSQPEHNAQKPLPKVRMNQRAKSPEKPPSEKIWGVKLELRVESFGVAVINKSVITKVIAFRMDNLFIKHCTAAIVTPNIFLFNLFLRNRVHSYIPFTSIVVLALTLAMVALLIFAIISAIARTTKGSLIISLLFWVFFWTFETTYGWVVLFSQVMTRVFWLLGFVAIMVFIAFMLRRYQLRFAKASSFFRILSVVLIVWFFVNFLPSFVGSDNLTIFAEESALHVESSRSEFFRNEFVVDHNLPKPDIYWLMPDAMLGLETLERFFGGNMDSFRNELSLRGFQIYEDALLNAGHTRIAINALFSPDFHDNYGYTLLAELSEHIGEAWGTALWRWLAELGLDILDLSEHHEMLLALRNAGYEINFISPTNSIYMPSPFHRLYDVEANVHEEYVLFVDMETDANSIVGRGLLSYFNESGDLLNLMIAATPVSILGSWLASLAHGADLMSVPFRAEQVAELTGSLDTVFERHYFRLLLDTFHTPSPKFVLAVSYFTHSWGLGMADTPWSRILPHTDRLLPSHEYAAEVLLNTIDAILHQNPDAIIVIQSDHGVHGSMGRGDHWDYLINLGYSNDKINELRHSVFSAVRIPLAYGGLDAPLAPLNISRELVNRFVGQNYTLLP